MNADFLQPTPVTACAHCERKFADEAARWAHMAEQHGVDAAERLRLTQHDVEAQAQFEALLREQARRMAQGDHS